MTLEWRLWRTLTPSFSGTTCRSLNSIRLEISALLLAGCMHVISFSPKQCSSAQGLPTVLPRLPPRVALHRVLPCLAKVESSQRNVTLAAPFFPIGIRQSRYGPLCSSVCTLHRTRSECDWTRTRPCSIIFRQAKQTTCNMFFPVWSLWWSWWSQSRSCWYSCRCTVEVLP